MVIEYLNSADTQRLIEFLGDGKLKFSVLEKSFKEAFPKDTHFNVSRAIQQLVQSMIKSGEGVGIVSSFFTLDIMCKMECETAKCVFYDALLELERVMRQDVCFTEQIKYASKETKEGKKSLEAINAEKYRFHCAAKGFAFRLLANKVSLDETSLAVLYDKQEQIDAALNAWEINSLQLKESIANIAHCWTQDVEKNSCEALSKNSAIFDSGVRAALLLQAARPQLPSLPLVSGELQFLTPGGSPGSDLLFFDTEPVTEEWKLSKKLIALSCNSLLNKEEQQQLIHTLSSGDLFHRLGINIELLSLMAIHNPDLSAALILKLPPQEGSQCIQQILKSSVPPEHAETVLLHASKILQQVNIRAYINGKLHLFKEKSTLSTSDKNSIKSFIMTLYQLVTKASKENKEVYIAETLKSEITQLCERCDLPEVSARWEELK